MNNFFPMPTPPPYETYDTKPRSKEERYRAIIQKHEISHDFSNRLQILQGFKVVFVFDDSGSMNTVLQDSPLNTGDNLFKATRWDELQYFAKIALEIASIFDPNGSDVYFLNRKPSPLTQITDFNQIARSFEAKPNGYTPMVSCLESVLANNSDQQLNEKKLLIIIATDGEPTDDVGRPNVKSFKRTLKSRSNKCFTTIVACTDDDDSIGYLNRWDRSIKNLDVVDDFRNERKEIKKIKGNSFPFSFGDYVVKSLVGSIDPELDQMDEPQKCSIL